jgi:hypothetical protein
MFMADKTTSHAKEVELDSYRISRLERYGYVKSQFDKVRDPVANQQTKDMNHEKTSVEGRESSMVKEDMPKLELRPPKEISKEQDNKTFDDKWQKEQVEAAKDQRTKDLMERYKDYEPASKKDDSGRDNSFENSR